MITTDKGYPVNGGGMINLLHYGELKGINPVSVLRLFDVEVGPDDGFTEEQIESAGREEELIKARDWVYTWLNDE